MCHGPMHEFLAALPKCEHHMHLEGSLEPDLLFDLAKRNNISLPSPKEDPAFTSISTLLERYDNFTSLDDFLHYYFIGMTVLIHASDFESLAYAYFQHAHSENVKHAEVFFDPQAHTTRGVAYADILQGFTAAQSRAKHDFGITSELIVCLLRHFSVEDCQQIYTEHFTKDLLPASGGGTGLIRGLGLSSTEKGRPPHLFETIYADAARRGVTHLTAHAGEEADVSYMASALHDLKVQRVDHGIKLADDEKLMREFADRRILLTVCPLSNVRLRCVKHVRDLPIRTYLEYNVPFSINSDDPAYFRSYILQNYCAVQEAFGFSMSEWETVATNAINLSWCTGGETRKRELLEMLRDVMGRFAGKME